MYRRRFLIPFALFFLAFLLVPTVASAAIPEPERDALTAIYNSTGGSTWTDRTNWLGAPGTECTWFGVRCNDGGSAVIAIQLQNNNLIGTIPPAIGALPSLESIELYSNRLSGPIPSSIGNLRALRDLTLFDNQLRGPLPRELGQLTNVTFFALGQNEIDGSIPPELGNLSKAEFFSFNGNRLTGPIPRELGGLTAARTLSLSYNQLEGPIPPELGRLTRLVELQLTDNRLTGPIPLELTTLIALEQFHVHINKLSGPIPPQIGQLANLRDLYLSNNDFSGPIPAEIGNLRSLTIFSATNNELSGPLPAEIGQLSNLTFLELTGNRLSGPLPETLSLLSKLEYLDLSVNDFTGTIPVSFSELVNLVSLSASNNRLTGPIPSQLGRLVKLQSLNFAENQLSGELRPELGELQQLREVVLYSNQLSGEIAGGITGVSTLRILLLGNNRFHGPMPPAISNLTELTYLDLAGNRFTGSIVPLGRLTKLEYLSLNDNQFVGPVQPELGLLTGLVDVRLYANRLSGTLPPQIGQLRNLRVLLLGDNRIEGRIPPEIGSLQKLEVLSLAANKFDGAIPAALGSLTSLTQLDLAQNALRPPIPRQLMNLTSLLDRGSDFSFNALSTTDTALRDFMNRKQNGNDWESTQTIAPTSVTVGDLTDRSAVVGWTTIANRDTSGGYRVSASLTPGGPPAAVATTDSKYSDSVLVRGLAPLTSYFFEVRTVSHPEGYQRNALVSDPTPPVSGTTRALVLLPPLIELASGTEGLVQKGSVVQNEDNFVLTNIGDVETTITLTKDGSFFEQTPSSFVIGAGQSQSVRVTAIPQPPGAYEGESIVSGLGVPPGLTIAVRLLSTPEVTGTVIASASTTRVDTSGERNTESVGSVSFTNIGTGTLSGIAVSDAPWIEAPKDLITIAPGATVPVNFTINRRERPDADSEDGGALAADFNLVYLDGRSSSASLSDYRSNQTAPSGVSTSLVTVVDTTKPKVGAASIPALPQGEVARFIAGVAQIRRGSASYISDLSVTNAFGSETLRDLRVYYTSPSNASASAATFSSVAPSSSVSLSSVVRTTFGADAQVGTLQLRTVDWDRILVNASLANIGRADRTLTTSLPVFRSDRSTRAGQKLYLTGLRRDENQRTDLYLQETSGNPASVGIEFIDAAGNSVGAPRPDDTLSPFALLELLDVLPGNAVSAVVTNRNASAGRVVAYARLTDLVSGDAWSLIDWNLFSDFTATEDVKIPLVRSTSGSTSPGRRRAVRRTSSSGASVEPFAETSSTRTEVSILNRNTTPAAGVLRFRSDDGTTAEKIIEAAPRQTVLISDVVGEFFGRPNRIGYLEFEPLRGEFALSTRIRETGAQPGSIGSVLPTIAASAGLRLGQGQTFAGLDDSTLETVNARRPGTFRTDFGIMETFGEPVTVRVTLLYFDGRSLATSRQTRSREFQLAAGQSLLVRNAANAILGPSREISLGNLHNIQLEFQVIGGDGAAAVFVTTTDNASQDANVRVE